MGKHFPYIRMYFPPNCYPLLPPNKRFRLCPCKEPFAPDSPGLLSDCAHAESLLLQILLGFCQACQSAVHSFFLSILKDKKLAPADGTDFFHVNHLETHTFC